MTAAMRDPWKGKQVLIAGEAGMSGSPVALKLVALGACVTMLDAMFPGDGGNAFNLSEAQQNLQVVPGDIRDGVLMRASVEDMDDIFNLADVQHEIESAQGNIPARDHRDWLEG